MIKKNITKILMILVLVSSTVIFSSSCYDSDGDSVVTIHLERNDIVAMGIQHQDSIIDKILRFFATPVEAAAWDTSHAGVLTLTIVHPKEGTQTIELSANTIEYEIALPPANSVIFTITHNTTYKNWGGQIVTDLTPGEMNVNIQMIPMAVIESIPMAYLSSRSIIISSFGAPPPSYTSGVKLYRSTSASGEYLLTTTTPFIPTGLNNAITENGTISAGTYYYKIRIYGPSGDGLLSAYFTQFVN